MHHDPLTHETPFSCAAVAPVGSGALDVMIHVVPFQTSVSGMRFDERSVLNPTAMHQVELRQVIPWKSVWDEPVGLTGVPWVHVEPFHWSTSGSSAPLRSPTATQKLGPAQLTPKSSLAGALGTVATAQLDPFHCSMRGPPVSSEPTDTQNELFAQELAYNCESCVVEGDVGSEGVKLVAPTWAGGVGMLAPA